MATVTVDSGELPSAKGKEGYELNRVLQHWGMIADGRFEYDCRALLQMIDEVDELRLWEYAHGGLYKTRDEFLEKAVLIDFDLTESSLNKIVGRLRGGEKFGLSRKEEVAQARVNAEQAKLNEESGKKINPSSNTTRVKDSPGSRSRLLRALARRAPEVLKRYECDEFTSVRAAAIAAGIVKVKTPLEQLDFWWAKASQDQQRIFAEKLKSVLNLVSY